MTGQELVGPVETAELVGSQDPTFLWVPEYTVSAGEEAIEHAADVGLHLDPWQRLSVHIALAMNRLGLPRFFEFCIILSRQNGKGSVLEALELAWLFLFGESLITHSAHLFETSRLHFERVLALITNHDSLRRRVRKVREGRGSEEIILVSGAILKFFTRHGGAGRGFTGGKVVLDEAMILDALMMSAVVPILATKPEAQIVYTGSAGFKTSTQLGLVRQRAYSGDQDLAMLEWAAQRPVYDDEGRLVAGDDPGDPRTWAKVNPNMGPPGHTGHVITADYIRKEMGALGGAASPFFWRERLGIGDYPVDTERWLVFSKEQWEACHTPTSKPSRWRVAGFDTDPERDVTTMVIASWATVDGVVTEAVHVEVVARHRGSLWCAGVAAEHAAEVEGMVFAMLGTGAAAHLKAALRAKSLRVEVPTEGAYKAGCETLAQFVRAGKVAHLKQPALRTAFGGGEKRENAEGGWVWARDVAAESAPAVAATIAMWALMTFPEVKEDTVGDVW